MSLHYGKDADDIADLLLITICMLELGRLHGRALGRRLTQLSQDSLASTLARLTISIRIQDRLIRQVRRAQAIYQTFHYGFLAWLRLLLFDWIDSH
jgi:hypothetical protein